MTSLRSARGLEFDRVYILGLHAGRMPGASQPPDARRRLLYSAMTRARATLVLAWPELAGGAPVRPSPFYEAARAVLAAEEEIHDEELFGPAESLHSTFRMMRDELLETVSRVGGELGELRLDTYMDLNRAVARYLELLKLAALIQRPAGQPVADALARINELLAQVASAEQVGELSESALDAYLLDAEREGQRRKLAIASRREPSLEAFIPRRGEGLMLSATDIQTYLTCPLKYKFARVFTIPRDPTINQRFGILIHQVLERYHAQAPEQQPVSRERSTGRTRDDVDEVLPVAPDAQPADAELQRLLTLFDAGWRRSGFGSSDDELQFRDRAVAALARYHERHRRADSRPVWFERSFAFQLGRHHLRGRVDRVDLLPDGGYELIDYKTGRPKTARELEEDVQLAVYGLGAREAWRLEPAAQSYYYVLDDRKVAVEPPPGQGARVQQTVLEVGEGILGQDFEPRPSYEVCSWCDYRLVCPAAEC